VVRLTLVVLGSLLLVLSLLPYWITDDYFGIKRVREFGIGLDFYRLRVVESGHVGQNDWMELGRLTDFDLFGLSGVLLLLGTSMLIGLRFVPRGSRRTSAGN
jgi:hypothetical protein